MRFIENDEEELGINLTPLIDVVFLLLIFFMVSTTFTKESELVIELPESSANKVDQRPEMMLIQIDANGGYAVQGPNDNEARRLLDATPKSLQNALVKAAGDDKKIATVIRADRNTPHQAVITAMDAAGLAGYNRIKLATQEIEN